MLYFLQYQSSDNTLTVNNTLTVIGTILLYIVIVVVVFLIIRELVMWYWKINQIITNQNKSNELMRELISTLQNVSNSNNKSEIIDSSSENKMSETEIIKSKP